MFRQVLEIFQKVSESFENVSSWGQGIFQDVLVLRVAEEIFKTCFVVCCVVLLGGRGGEGNTWERLSKHFGTLQVQISETYPKGLMGGWKTVSESACLQGGCLGSFNGKGRR